MGKLRGAKKLEFLRRMARGRAKARRASGTPRKAPGRRAARRTTTRSKGYSGTIYKSRKHPGVVRFRVRRNPLQALIANPESAALVPYGYDFAPKRRVKKRRSKKGASSMAKRRRRSGKRRTRRAAPRRRAAARRRVYRRRPRHRRRPRAIARLGAGRTRTIYVNPSGRRRHRRIRRRRNPGFGGLLRMAFVPYATGLATAAASAMLDSGLAQWPIVTHLVKVTGAVGIAAFFGRKHPLVASAAIGALGASQGYPLVTKLAGGMFAHTPAQAVKGLGEMSDSYPEMGALLQGGLGALLSGPSDVPVTASNYQTALMNMGDDDDDS